MNGLLAGVELGGTKVLAAVTEDPLAPLASVRIPTTDPAATLDAVLDFFQSATSRFGAPAALGIGSFGPIGIRPGSEGYGRMGATPKAGWAGADIVGALGKRLECPVSLDTDVNAAALAELRWGAGRGLRTFAYLTVGTGIGGGLIVDGRPVHGALHPEIGHVPVRRHPGDRQPSLCNFHDDCAEGLASGPAIFARFSKTFEDLPSDHPFREALADYLGQLCATLVLVASVERIIIGGGVGIGAAMHDQVRRRMRHWLNGYAEPVAAQDEGFIVPPELGGHAGLAGAFALAQDVAGAAA